MQSERGIFFVLFFFLGGWWLLLVEFSCTPQSRSGSARGEREREGVWTTRRPQRSSGCGSVPERRTSRGRAEVFGEEATSHLSSSAVRRRPPPTPHLGQLLAHLRGLVRQSSSFFFFFFFFPPLVPFLARWRSPSDFRLANIVFGSFEASLSSPASLHFDASDRSFVCFCFRWSLRLIFNGSPLIFTLKIWL